MNTVGFETAKILADAGFPQPAPQRGQIWFLTSGVGMVVTCGGDLLDTEMCDYVTASGTLYLSRTLNDGEVFAPTATDILRDMPGWMLTYTTVSGWQLLFEKTDDFGYNPVIFNNENPAEAAAEAWLWDNKV